MNSNSDISSRAGTKLSRLVIVLAIVMIVNVVIIILLTPIGFETRPQSHLKPLGYIAITAIFFGLALDLASIGLLFKRIRVRLASGLAIVSSVLFFLIILVDRTGSFFSVPIPPAINTLEYIFIVVLIVTLFIASSVHRGSKATSS
jgi:uncharacterized membrane protein YhaH (DUF805 family)